MVISEHETPRAVRGGKLSLRRRAPFNRSPFFDDYVKRCSCVCRPLPAQSAVIASDDVFDFMLTACLSQPRQ